VAALNHDVPRSQVVQSIDRLMDNLVNIKDETGEFLLHLEDGRIIDTKGWAGWEWTHGVGLFGMWRYYEQTGDKKALTIIKQWFEDRFAEGTPTCTSMSRTRATSPISTPGRSG
jgi:unsaturated rhamnogalacturonyl hydrolase